MTKSQKYYRANKSKWREKYGPTYRKKHRAKIRAAQRKWAFGLAQEDYDALLREQKGVCAACGKPETTLWRGILRSLAVDHDHQTGRVRGLLCGRCNVALGLLGDTAAGVRALLKYLEQT